MRFSPWAVEHMQVPEELHLPDEADQSGFAIADIDRIRTALRATTVDRPHAELSMLLPIDGELRWHHVSLCALWSDEIPPLYIGAVGLPFVGRSSGGIRVFEEKDFEWLRALRLIN